MSDPELEFETALRTTLLERARSAPAGDDLADTVTHLARTRRLHRRVAAGGTAVLVAGVVAGLAGAGYVPFANDDDPEPTATEPAPVEETPLTCGTPGWPTFGPSLLADRPPLDPASDIGRAASSDPPSGSGPIEGWTLAGQVGSSAYVMAWLADGGVLAATYEQTDDGSWSLASNLDCVPQRAFDDGLQSAEWTLLNDLPRPETTSLVILVTDPGCTSGRSPASRLADPVVEYRDDAVLITPRLEPLPAGFYDCQGSPSAQQRVELTEPLGDRQLLDGRWYPARPVLPNPNGAPMLGEASKTEIGL